MARYTAQPSPTERAGIDRFLRWGLLVTLALVIAALIYGTVRVYQGQPPIPERVVAPDGTVLYTRDDILDGKMIFQRTDLMDFGSLYGNGAYFGPDWGTDYLHRQSVFMHDFAANLRFGAPYDQLSPTDRAAIDQQVISELKANRYADGVLRLSAGQAVAHQELLRYYRHLFIAGDKALGLTANTVRDSREADHLAALFAWTAWTSTVQRPGESFSYTNNWPYDPTVGNTPTNDTTWWSWASLGGLALVGTGVYFFYRRFMVPAADEVHEPSVPTAVSLTASQKSTAKWFLLVPVLLLTQALLGTLIAHYYADRSGWLSTWFMQLLPFQVVKAAHLQLAIAWIAAAWMGAGLFLAPLVGRREPRFQRLLANALWAAVVLVVVGASIGLWLGVKGVLPGTWFWLGNQGLEFLQLGRAFQIALLLGLLLWAVILLRAFWPGLRIKREWGSLEHLLLYSGIAIAFVYAFGMLPLNQAVASITLIDFWRWWVIHFWVENVFEFFVVAVTGYAVLSMGLLSRRWVERIVYFELILVFGTGIIGMGHHFYWIADPAMWLALGSMFSMLEVIPLAVMMARAWQEYRAIHAAGRDFPQRTAFSYLTGAAIWNIVGAGVLGGVINPPIASYFEHGQYMTLAHAHASMFGVFGLLAIGLLYLCLRGMTLAARWSDRLGLWALRSFHAAIVLWLALNLLPIGIAQWTATITHGYWYARSPAFYQDWTLFQWLRLPGDAAFLLGGLVLFMDVVMKVRAMRKATVAEAETSQQLLLPVSDTRGADDGAVASSEGSERQSEQRPEPSLPMH